MKIKDDFKKIPDWPYEVNVQGIVRRTDSNEFIRPAPAPDTSGNFRYRLHNDTDATDSRVHRLMLKVWGIDREYKKEWFNEILKIVGDRFENRWRRVPGTKFTISSNCSLRVDGKTRTITPTRNKSEEYFSYKVYNRGNGKKRTLSIRPLFFKAFGYEPPEKFTKRYPKEKYRPIAPKNEFQFSCCPYAENKIQPLYGKMGAEFSPLDWYHQQLPEAVMIGVK